MLLISYSTIQFVNRKNRPKFFFRLCHLLFFIYLFNIAPRALAEGGTPRITLSFSQAPLEKIFREIKKQSGYEFIYTRELLQQSNPITIRVNNVLLEEALSLCLKEQPISYKMLNRTIVLKPKSDFKSNDDKKNNAVVNNIDPITVTGKITDGKGNPLPGANIKIKGTTVGTTADNNGLFKLNNIDQGTLLEVSFVGYEPQIIPIHSKLFFTIILSQKQTDLDETVVIAYGSTTRRFATGNVSSVKASDIEKQPVQNPILALQGRVPGIEITQKMGTPGGGVSIRVQGINSIRSGLDPLIVVDGVPIASQLIGDFVESSLLQGGSPLNYINPADIESIDVLKDADATSIYGSRAANGAVLITTKKGKAGSSKVNLNIQQGWGKVNRRVDMMNTRQYLDMRYEAFRHDGIVLNSPSVVADDLKVWDTTRYTDWQKELLGGTAKYTNINTGISGGTNTIQYLVNGTFNRQTLVIPGTFDDKVGNIHTNISGTLFNQHLKFQLSSSFMFDKNHLPAVDLTPSALQLEPNAPSLYNSDGSLNWAQNAAGKSTWSNPLLYVKSSDFKNATKNQISNLQLGYKVFQDLEIQTSIGYTSLNSSLFRPYRLELNKPENRINASRYADFANRSMNNWIIEPLIKYKKRIKAGQLDVVLGSTIQQSNSSYLSVRGTGFYSDAIMQTLSAATSISINSSTATVERYNALFGRVGFIWDDKYLLSITGRRDGSNKFGDNSKFNNFGSIGVGWIFSQENAIHQLMPIISFGKLRMSYGVTGNDQIPNFSYLSSYYLSNPSILYQGGISLSVSNIPNPYLKWERTNKWQMGLDLGVLHDRVLFGFTYAQNRSSNQLISYTLPTITGFNSYIKNFPATIENISIEFTLNSTNIKAGKFSWSTNANLTIPKNRVISFPGIELTGYADGSGGVAIGQPIGVKYLFPYAGLNPTNGMYVFVNKNTGPTLSPLTPSKFISTQSNFYGGVNNHLSFKGWSLDFLFQFVRVRGAQDYYWSSTRAYPGQFIAGLSNQPVTVLDRWIKPGDLARVSPFSTSNFTTSTSNSDAYYNYNSSYVRLKNVSLSWQLPARMLEKAKMQNASLYFRGQNLLTFTNYPGLDPESGSGSLPPLQLWTIGVNAVF